MYHTIVKQRITSTWRRIDAGDWRAATELAVEGVHFHFRGDTALGLEANDRAAFEAWFERLYRVFPGIRFTLEDVVVAGWPWKTTFVARVKVQAPLKDGSAYTNVLTQWGQLRWGRLVDDVVQEDTVALQRALAVQLA